MSKTIPNAESDTLRLDNGLEALRESPEFRGPVESIGDRHSNDHLAAIYETRDEQFSTVVPFVRQGLERGERCLYIADENEIDEVLAAMRERGVDVDAALESGALSMHTAQDTYLRNGAFDPDDMIAFLAETLEDAGEEYEGLRITGEMTWVLGDDPQLESLIEYEAKLNDFFPGTDSIALCQYNRERFPAEVLRDVVKTHPHLVYENTVCQNFYYTPPEEFFGPEQPSREVDRMMETLCERTEAKVELQDHKEHLRELYETTGNSDLPFEETVEKLLELGCERFGMKGGGLSYLPEWDGEFRAEVTVGSEMPDEPGVLPTQPEDGCFCRQAITQDEPTAASNVAEVGWDDDPVVEDFGFTTYFGIRVTAGADPYGTLWFYDTSPRGEPFTDDERTFLELMGQWVSDELERTERNRAQRELYEIAADSDLSFDQKVDRLLDLGRERFGLDMGFFLEKEGDQFRVVKTRGSDLEEGVATLSACPGQYCKQTITVDAPLGVEDAAAVGWDDDPLYQEYDLGCYLGTRVTDRDGVFGTVCFASSSARDIEFTDAEYTFLDLLGQWLSHELKQRQNEKTLEESIERLEKSNERLEQFAYAASHDLQEPLRMVSSYLRLIERRAEDELSEESREFLEFAVDGADRMRDMIDALLKYSRVETRGEPLEPIDLDRVLDDVLDDLQLQIEETDATLDREPLPRVSGDGNQLRQVLQNLLENAIKYSGDEPPRIRVGADRRDEEWVISVRDEGIGIDPDDADAVFDVFDRLHSREEYEGTGIGLALCERIVERHEGEIWVDSEPGEGSTFSFTLPAADRGR